MSAERANALYPLFVVGFAALFGAAIGSFLNVCILRWGTEPKQSVVRPPSRCPRCGRGLTWYENVPVLSWILLRGRCRGCANPISVQYPLVELATAMLWGFFAWRHGASWLTLTYAVFTTLLLGIAMTDAREYIIPNEFTYGGMLLGLITSLPGGPPAFVASLQGMFLGAGLLYLIGSVGSFAAGRDAMGGGDVAMMAMVGAFLGWESVCVTVFFGASLGVVLHLATKALAQRFPEAETAPSGPAPSDPQFKTKAQLRREGYLPFGVSLAIAAGIIALTDARWAIVAWVADYASFAGL